MSTKPFKIRMLELKSADAVIANIKEYTGYLQELQDEIENLRREKEVLCKYTEKTNRENQGLEENNNNLTKEIKEQRVIKATEIKEVSSLNTKYEKFKLLLEEMLQDQSNQLELYDSQIQEKKELKKSIEIKQENLDDILSKYEKKMAVLDKLESNMKKREQEAKQKEQETKQDKDGIQPKMKELEVLERDLRIKEKRINKYLKELKQQYNG